MALTAEDRWHEQAHTEVEIWHQLCTRLVLAKAVTAADLRDKPGSTATTGVRLLNLLREWGDARATLALTHAAYQKENPE